ncbi:MAG: extracellular solute-binding protein [Roseovarius sp.]
MRSEFFRSLRAFAAILGLVLSGDISMAEPSHGIAMYGDPALPPDFVSLPYANPDAPKGGQLITGNVGGFDSLNPFARKGTPPWQLRFLAYESLMGRSYDEPFTLYGLLAETIETSDSRDWVEFTLREEARFSDGSPVTVEDVIWSYETLGTAGNLRYAGLWGKIDTITATGPRSVRITFNVEDRELALIAGLRPILKKPQFDDRAFGDGGIEDIPLGTAPYVVDSYEIDRNVVLARNPDYWGNALPLRRGTHNFDTIRIEFYGDDTVMKEAFKAQALSFTREFNAEKWQTQYDFPAVQRGDIVLSEIPHQKPSGITGFVLNTRNAPLDDWRVRDALIHAFNFEFINDTLTGGRQPRITSYFSNSELAMQPGPATGRVLELLTPFEGDLQPGTLEGYTLPHSDGSKRNRANLRRAITLLDQAGWTVQDGVLKNAEGQALELDVLLKQDALIQQATAMMDIYARALDRLGIALNIQQADKAQYNEREANFDFDITFIRRAISLSPGNEQALYWGSDAADRLGSRNLMGMKNPAADAMIRAMLTSATREDFIAATRALDRVLTAGRYVIPIHTFAVGRVAHLKQLRYPSDRLPLYGDGIHFLPAVWWWQE